MSGWLYLIKNGDLYKIGITKNIDKRMRQLKPDEVVAKIYSRDFVELEKQLHKRYKNVRIPQTEYFRLDYLQIRDIKQIISNLYYPKSITYSIFINSFFLLFILLLIVVSIISLNIKDINTTLFNSLLIMEKISLFLSFLSLFLKSNKYFSWYNELKFRASKFLILILFTFLFRFTSLVLF